MFEWVQQHLEIIILIFVATVVVIAIWTYITGKSTRLKLSIKDGVEIERGEKHEATAQAAPALPSGVSFGSDNTFEGNTFGSIVGGDQLIDGESANITVDREEDKRTDSDSRQRKRRH
jgi:flagellar basal body-associated protein FliL